MKGHPNTKRLKQFLDFLEPRQDTPINMYSVKPGYCDTPHCHAGEWAIFFGIKPEVYRFKDAAMQASEFLMEMENEPISLCRWAKRNPELWGNRRGLFMFCSSNAFCSDEKYGEGKIEKVKSVQQLYQHWKGVYERLIELEQSKSEKTV